MFSFLVRKYILQLYCNGFEIQQLAAAHCDSVCIRKSGTSQPVCAIALKLVICIPALIFSSNASTNQKTTKGRATVLA